MIDWTKPIETVDGRKARLVETLRLELWLLVWVASENEGPGDFYIVDVEGCRCDSRSIEMGLQTSQFIRTARVKRKAWVSLRCIEFAQMADTKDGIESQISQRDRDNGWVACYVEWEE